MRAVSETFSTVLITSVLLALLGVLSFYTFVSMAGFNTTTEYAYYRQAFLSIGNSLMIPIMGGSYEISVPTHQQSIGYSRIGSISIFLNNTSIPEYYFECTGLISGVRGLSRPNATVYGGNEYIVNDLRLVPRVLETYGQGETKLYLDTCRLLVDSEVARGLTGVTFFYRISYYNLSVKLEYRDRPRGIVKVSMSGSPAIFSGYALNMSIIFTDSIIGRTLTATPRNLSSIQPGIPLVYIITVYNVEVEVN